MVSLRLLKLVVRVVKAGIAKKEQQSRWPAVFNSKKLKSSYQNKGAASKFQVVHTGKYYYETIFGTYEMHGAEGRMANYVRSTQPLDIKIKA